MGKSRRGIQLKGFFLTIMHSLHRDGVRSTLRRSVENVRGWRKARNAGAGTEDAFDREFGTDTAGTVPLWKLRIDSPNATEGIRYQACNSDWIRHSIEGLPVEPEDYVFVDLGSGKGRALLVASDYPFRRVLGVEFSPELHAVAARNIGRYQTLRGKCHDVVSLCADAASWELPVENLVLFLYNPFGECVLRSVLANLRASLERHDRSIYLVYHHAVFSGLLDAQPFLERIELPTTAAVYRHRPAEDAPIAHAAHSSLQAQGNFR